MILQCRPVKAHLVVNTPEPPNMFRPECLSVLTEAAKCVFELGDAGVQSLKNLPRLRWQQHAILAMMASGGIALNRIFESLAAGAAGAKSLCGCGVHHGAQFRRKE
jgi:hypothetical protein